MPTIGIRNAEAQQIGSTDHLRVENKNFAGEWYDSAGGLGFIGAVVVPLAGQRLNPAPEIFSMSSNVLTILEAGIFLFLFNMTAAQPGSASGEMIWQGFLQEDAATGTFATVAGTISTGFFKAGNGTINNHAILDVKANYRYRLMVSRLGGSDTPQLTSNGSKLSVMRLYKNG